MEKRILHAEFFDRWITEKSDEIIIEMDKRKLTSEELIILTIESQANNFKAFEKEIKNDISSIKVEIKELRIELQSDMKNLVINMREENSQLKKEMKLENSQFKKEMKAENSQFKKNMQDQNDSLIKRMETERSTLKKEFGEDLDRSVSNMFSYLKWLYGLLFVFISAVLVRIFMT